MEIYIASDRHGWVMKNEIVKHLKGNHTYSVIDLGPKHEKTVDPSCYAFFVSKAITDDTRNLGILISKTGNEMLIPANRNKYIRACLCTCKETAKIAKKELDSNIIVLQSEMATTENPLDIIDLWLKTKYDENDVENVRKNMLMDYVAL